MKRSEKKSHLFAVVSILLILLSLASGVIQAQDEPIKIGLITKTETNPFFVKMREGAQAAADQLGVELLKRRVIIRPCR